MYCVRKNTSRKGKKEIKEGTLVRIHSSQDIRLRIQDPEFGHLEDLGFYGDPVVGVVTKLWPAGRGGRELELLSEGDFLILTTSNGFEIDEIEVLE